MKGAIAYSLELTDASLVEPFVRQRLACRAAFHDAQSAVLPELLLRRKPVWSLDESTKDMGTYRSYARHLHELLDFGVLLAQPHYVLERRFLGCKCRIQHCIQVQ